MMSLGEQFRKKMSSRSNGTQWDETTVEVGDKLVEGAQERTRRGETVRGGNYKETYARSTKRAKGKTDPVTLRDTDYSIRQIDTKNQGSKQAGIRGRERFHWHNNGNPDTNLPQRQMFPKSVAQVPKDVKKFASNAIKKILLGAE